MQSLLDPAQQSLLPALSAHDHQAANDAEIALSTSGQHTAARLFSENPRLYKAICWAYASGSAGQLRCAAIFGVSVHTVRAIIAREGLRRAAIAGAKIVEQLTELRELTAETLLERLADPEERSRIPVDRLMIGLGILCDKVQAVGAATPGESVNDSESVPAVDAYRDWLRSGSVVADTGIEGSESVQKGLESGEVAGADQVGGCLDV